MRATWATWAMVCGGVLLAIAAARADEVLLTSGGTIRGQVVSEDEDEVVVRTDSGKVSIPRSKVKEVKRSQRKAAAPEAMPEGAPPDEAGGVTLTRVPWREGERVDQRVVTRRKVVERLKLEGFGGKLPSGDSDLTRAFTLSTVRDGAVLGYAVDVRGRGTVEGQPFQVERALRVSRRGPRERARVLEPEGQPAQGADALAIPHGPTRTLLGSLADAVPAGTYRAGQVVKLTVEQVERLSLDLLKSGCRLERGELIYREQVAEGDTPCALFQVRIEAQDQPTPEIQVSFATSGELRVELSTGRLRRSHLETHSRFAMEMAGEVEGDTTVDETWSYPGR